MINIDTVKNIKDIENIKINLLENVTTIFKKIDNGDIDIKDILINNIEITKSLASKLNIDIEK